MPRVVIRWLAVLLAVGVAVALYASTLVLWNMLSDRADATCRTLADGNDTYSVTPSWRGGITWDCEYATDWNPRGTVVLTPGELLCAE